MNEDVNKYLKHHESTGLKPDVLQRLDTWGQTEQRRMDLLVEDLMKQYKTLKGWNELRPFMDKIARQFPNVQTVDKVLDALSRSTDKEAKSLARLITDNIPHAVLDAKRTKQG